MKVIDLTNTEDKPKYVMKKFNIARQVPRVPHVMKKFNIARQAPRVPHDIDRQVQAVYKGINAKRKKREP